MDINHLITLSSRELQAQGLTADEMLKLQAAFREMGRCGSLQTYHGTPCQKIPRLGWTVCERHGANAPQTAAKAERLLAAARMPAIGWILESLEQAARETCPTCGFPQQTLKAARRIDALAFRLLDRTGFGPHSKIDIRTDRDDQPDVLIEAMTDAEREELGALYDAADGLRNRVRLRLAQAAAATGPPGGTALGLPAGREAETVRPMTDVATELARVLAEDAAGAAGVLDGEVLDAARSDT